MPRKIYHRSRSSNTHFNLGLYVGIVDRNFVVTSNIASIWHLLRGIQAEIADQNYSLWPRCFRTSLPGRQSVFDTRFVSWLMIMRFCRMQAKCAATDDTFMLGYLCKYRPLIGGIALIYAFIDYAVKAIEVVCNQIGIKPSVAISYDHKDRLVEVRSFDCKWDFVLFGGVDRTVGGAALQETQIICWNTWSLIAAHPICFPSNDHVYGPSESNNEPSICFQLSVFNPTATRLAEVVRVWVWAFWAWTVLWVWFPPAELVDSFCIL